MALEGFQFQRPRMLKNDGTLTMPETDFLQMKADALNAGSGSLSDGDCQICKNKGTVFFVSSVGLSSRDCECMAARRSRKKLRESGLSDSVKSYTMESYVPEKDWQKKAKELAQKYLSKGRGKWFVLSGSPGSGKTHLCTAICGEMLNRNIEVRYMLWRTEISKLKSCVNERDKYEKIMQDYAQCNVLYIDDFFKGSVTEADINVAFELINARYIGKKAGTIISSERSIEQILEIDEAIGSRIAEMSTGYCFKTPKENIRLQKAAAKGGA